jgi:hypothetical protein
VFYLMLILLFIAVFAFLGWRIISVRQPVKPSTDNQFACPRCNEQHCDCQRISEEK